MKKFKIGFAGLTHLGLTYLTAAILKKNYVIAFDLNKKKIHDFKLENFQISEKSLISKLKKNKKNLFFTNDINELNKCDFIFISCDIETDLNNKSNYKDLNNYINLIKKFIVSEIPIIILSQVKPGFMRKFNLNKLKLYYQVETLIFGKALAQAIKPTRIIVGKASIEDKLDLGFQNYLKTFNCPIIEMSFESAELCKLAINIILASNISAANTIASIAEKIDADYSKILEALRLDKRIGNSSYIVPGLGISGGNLERDIYTTKDLIRENKILNNNMMNSISKISETRKNWVFEVFNKINKTNQIKKITIFGFSYKKDNSSFKNSPTVFFLKKLKKKKIDICLYDDFLIYHKDNFNISFSDNPESALKNSDILIIMRDFKKNNFFYNLNYSQLMRKKFVIDPFAVAKKLFFNNKKFNYFTIGSKIWLK